MSEELDQETPDVEKQKPAVDEDSVEVFDDIEEEAQAIPGTVENVVLKTEQEEKSKETDGEILDSKDIDIEDVNKSIEEHAIVVQDYLDPSILDVKVVNEADMEQFEEKSEVSKNLSEQYEETFADIRQQEVVTGSVVGLTDRDVLIDIGFKAEGIVPRTEFDELPDVGQEVDVFIRTFEDRRGNMLLSKEKADFQKRWQEIRDCFENEELITGLITRRIKGGMVVDLGVVQAFLPGSQLDIKPVTDFDEYLGVESEFKIVKFNELRQNIVLSRKAILEGDLIEKRQAVLNEMEVGMVLEGIVKNITDFGAFIDLGGVDGLLHITDITWGRINHPLERLELGETINVKVIDFDIQKIRVSLGLKQLQPDPWENILEKFPVDSIIEGKIVSLMNYGVFVELEDGVEGLIHISEMSWIRHIRHPSDIFQSGDKISAKILNIDADDKKISMGIKQLQDNPWDTIDSKYPIGSDHKGVVRNLTQFGAFVELEEGIDGLVHISDMSWVKLVRHPKDIIQNGDTVKVRILEVSSEDRRLSLGMKQIEENPWEEIRENFSSGKVINGEILKILDKGIIFKIEEGLEGIVPLRSLNKDEKQKIHTIYKEGDTHEITVQEVDEESKKIILMMDIEIGTNEKQDPVGNDINDSPDDSPEKIEIPQDIIDQISEDGDIDEDSDSVDPEETTK